MPYTHTAVMPRQHYVDNFGVEVQAVTFQYGETVHSINRRGKRNVLGFLGADRTYTLTNGTDKFVRMNASKVRIIGYTLITGEDVDDLP